ncbi:MAG: lytic transglycosylase domain-containing protein [Gammaproteobacteria bacterium]
MQLGNIAKFSLMLVAVLVVSGCNKITDKTSSKIILNTQTNQVVDNKMHDIVKKPIILIPSNMSPVKGTLVNTMWIGTVAHPTLNGGIINAANGVSVNQDNPSMGHPSFTNRMKQLPAKQKPVMVNDKWATSSDLRVILESAARTGKLTYVLKQAAAMKLPASVAIVPIIESGYQDNVLSSKGAAGAWQLMPHTAQTYGLKTTDRYQFVPATQAALTLLAQLHQQFGNWTLAFAAYNAGAFRVQQALLKNPYARTLNELNLPSETQHYVQRLQAVNQTLLH